MTFDDSFIFAGMEDPAGIYGFVQILIVVVITFLFVFHDDSVIQIAIQEKHLNQFADCYFQLISPFPQIQQCRTYRPAD